MDLLRAMVVQNAPQHLAQLEGLCGGVCEDLFNLSTKPDPQQEASGFVATFANSRRAVGKCVNGLYGKFAPFKGV